jgi:hypothetical protein
MRSKKGGTMVTLIEPTSLSQGTMVPSYINSLKRNSIETHHQKTHSTISDIIDYIIENYIKGKLTSYKLTDDYKTHSLIPGQQIAYGGAFGIQQLKHYGIYLGNGLIYELAPQTENKSLRVGPEIAVGISNIDYFYDMAVKKNSPIYVYDYEDLETDNKKTIEDRLSRVLEFSERTKGRNKQFLIYGNCESVSNYISYGQYRTQQGEGIVSSIILSVLIYNGRKFIKKKITGKNLEIMGCSDFFSTVYDCPCESKTKSFKNIAKHGFNKYCYINNLSCTNKSMHDKDRDGNYWGKIKKNKEHYKLLATKKKNKIKYRWKKCSQSSMRTSSL